jgi:hypothetical protein
MQDSVLKVMGRYDREYGEPRTGVLAAADTNWTGRAVRYLSVVAGVQWECCLVTEGRWDPNERRLEEPLKHRTLERSVMMILCCWNGHRQERKTGVGAAPAQGVISYI